MIEGTDHRPAVSVVLPVYNVRDYIDKCICALKSQTLYDMEFIFVDDCSTDDSMNPVEKWAKEDKRVYIIYNEENIGSGLSRNKGIETARGEYLAFADPDDWMAEDFYELLFSKATYEGNPDIVKGRCCKVDGKKGVAGEPESSQNERIRTGIAKESALYCLFTYEHWTAIYNRILFNNKDVRYGRSVTSQDTTFQLCATYYAKNIVLEDNAIYYYLQRKDSAVNADAMKRTIGNLDSIDEKIDFLLKKPYEPQFGNYLRQTMDSVLRAYQDSLGKGLISSEIFGIVSDRLSSSLKRFPDYHKKFEKLPRLNSLINKKPKVSVVVPVYNSGIYLEELFSDLSAQTLCEYEVICVDDGSTDDSLTIIMNQCDKDSRFIYIHEENAGAGKARNEGLKRAGGEYVIFLDADDRYSADLLAKLYNAAERKQADIVMCLYDEYNYDLERLQKNKGFDKRIFPDGETVDPKNIAGLFNCIGIRITDRLFRRSFIIENGLEFSSTQVANDVFFLHASATVAKGIVGVHENLLTVRKHLNPHSISSARAEHTEDAVEVLVDVYDWCMKKGIAELYTYSYKRKFFDGVEYNAEFTYNRRFVRSVARALGEEQPWVDLGKDKTGSLFRRFINPSEYRIEIQRLQKKLDNDVMSESSGLQESIRRLYNKIIHFSEIEQILFDQYGIVVPDNDHNESDICVDWDYSIVFDNKIAILPKDDKYNYYRTAPVNKGVYLIESMDADADFTITIYDFLHNKKVYSKKIRSSDHSFSVEITDDSNKDMYLLVYPNEPGKTENKALSVKMRVVKMAHQVSKERYGRDFEINNSMPFCGLGSDKEERIVGISEEKNLSKVYIADVNNAGDRFNYELLDYFDVRMEAVHIASEADLLMLGGAISALQNTKKPVSDKPLHVWGSGFLFGDDIHDPLCRPNIIVHALRGQLSKVKLSGLLGRELPEALPLADPGLMASCFASSDVEKKYSIGFVPHFREHGTNEVEYILSNNKDMHFIDITGDCLDVIRELQECECVISSSLHGLIFSDSLHIPNLHARITELPKGGSFKYRDYYSAFNLEDPALSVEDVVGMSAKDIMKRYKVNADDVEEKKRQLIESFPKEFTRLNFC